MQSLALCLCRLLFLVALPGCGSALAGEVSLPASRLKVGIVQMSLARSIVENRDRIVSGISNVAARGVRVAVVPEGALRGEGNENAALVNEAVDAIRRAARERNVYVLFGGASRSPKANKELNWMYVIGPYVIGPDGRDLFRYDKLYDRHDARCRAFFRSTVFRAARSSAQIGGCAVWRKFRSNKAKLSFELSCNFASEWTRPMNVLAGTCHARCATTCG